MVAQSHDESHKPSYDPSVHLAIVTTENSTMGECLVSRLGMTGLEEMTHQTGEIIVGGACSTGNNKCLVQRP